MSGLSNETQTGGKFLNFKDGKIISAANGEKESYTNLTGMLTELDIVDETYKGKDYKKIILFIKDDEGNVWKLGFPLESGYGNSFCSLAKNIDFAKPVNISGGKKELDNDKTFGTLFVKQDGNPLKWFYTKESTEVPKGIKSKDRTGEYWDFSARNEFYFKMLLNEVRPAILKASGVDIVKEAKTTKGKK